MRISDWSSDVCSSDLLGHDGFAVDGGLVLGKLGCRIGAAERQDVGRGVAVARRDERDILAAEQELDAELLGGIIADLDDDRLDQHLLTPRVDRKSTSLNSSH